MFRLLLLTIALTAALGVVVGCCCTATQPQTGAESYQTFGYVAPGAPAAGEVEYGYLGKPAAPGEVLEEPGSPFPFFGEYGYQQQTYGTWRP